MAVAEYIDRYGNNSAGEVMPFTVSSSVAIPARTLMVLSASPRTIAAHSAEGEKFVGIASAEKDASDSSTTLGVVTNCTALLSASGSISDGDIVCLSATANAVYTNNSETDYTKIVGMALSDAANSLVPVRILK